MKIRKGPVKSRVLIVAIFVVLTSIFPSVASTEEIDPGFLDIQGAEYYSGSHRSNFPSFTSSNCSDLPFFQAPTFSVATSPQNVVAADFDGDGKPDIATSSYATLGVSILRNLSGAGHDQFGNGITLPVGSNSNEVTGADVDSDGRIDLLTFNTNGSISVFLNNSTGAGTISFAPKVEISVGSDIRKSAIADFDGDGKMDIALVFNGGTNVVVLKNNSNGPGVVAFTSGISLAAGIAVRSIGTGDLDGDGKPDIAVSSNSSLLAKVFRNTSNSDLSFESSVSVSLPVNGGWALKVADIDGDGKSDISIASATSSYILVLRNASSGPGNMLFAPASQIYTGQGLYAIAADDLDGDGKLDLAVGSDFNVVYALRNTSSIGAISFSLRTEFGVGQNPRGVFPSDFDGDGKIDLVTANSNGSSVSFLRNSTISNGQIEFESRFGMSMDLPAESPRGSSLVDLDLDGRLDVVTANYSDNFTVFRNAGSAVGVTKFDRGIQFTAPVASRPFSVAADDLDNDGRKDVVVGNDNSNDISIYLNMTATPGSIAFSAPVNFPVGGRPEFVAVADINNDDKPDLITINRGTNNISILKNTGSAPGNLSFDPQITLPVNSEPSSAAVADFDGDGRVDIAVSNFVGTTVSIFRNATTGPEVVQFDPKIDLTANSNPYSVIAGDFDGDGRIDFAVSNRINNTSIISVFRNVSPAVGAIQFAPKLDLVVAVNTQFTPIAISVLAADLQHDGKLDLIANNTTNRTLSILRNTERSPGNIGFLAPIETDLTMATSSIASGDLNNDGSVDIVSANYNSNGVGIFANPCRLSRVPFDFDGDYKTDVSIFRPNGATGSEWWYLKSSNGGNFATQFGSPMDKLVAADYTGDGKADIAFFRPSTGFWYILRSEDSSFYAFPFGASGDIPAPADFDGDGKADAAVFRPSTATWFIQNSGGGTTIQAFGAAGDVPVVGDYDGDGKADIAIFRPNGATGSEWWILRSTAGLIATQFGTPTDKTVPGDYTGDGKADVAIWRPSNGQWYILRSEDLSFYAFPFGANGDIPVPGDYDGDGKTDAAVFRPASSTWFAQGSTAGTIIQQFGTAGDVPVPSEFVR